MNPRKEEPCRVRARQARQLRSSGSDKSYYHAWPQFYLLVVLPSFRSCWPGKSPATVLVIPFSQASFLGLSSQASHSGPWNVGTKNFNPSLWTKLMFCFALFCKLSNYVLSNSVLKHGWDCVSKTHYRNIHHANS